jgi:hypothetical protein
LHPSTGAFVEESVAASAFKLFRPETPVTEILSAPHASGVSPAPVRSNFRRSAQGREIVLVLGMHRSGTSLLANILHLLGVDMLDAKPHTSHKNPSGFWEREDLVAIQDEILNVLGCPIGSPVHCTPLPAGWWRSVELRPLKAKLSDAVAAHLSQVRRPWGFKDPRTCRLLPLWGEILEELDVSPRFVWAVRHPSESAVSMAEKNPNLRRLNAAETEVMWLAYNYDILRYAGGHWPVVVPYDTWFADPMATARELAAGLDLVWPGSEPELEASLQALINPEWRHQWAEKSRASARLQISEDLYRSILGLRGASEAAAVSDLIEQPLQSLFAAVQPFAAMARAARDEVLALRSGDQPGGGEAEKRGHDGGGVAPSQESAVITGSIGAQLKSALAEKKVLADALKKMTASRDDWRAKAEAAGADGGHPLARPGFWFRRTSGWAKRKG